MKRWLNPTTPGGLVAIVILMFGFGFMLVPLYDVFCEVTGLNGKTSGPYVAEANEQFTPEERLVTIQFVANRNNDLPWHFAPAEEQMKLALGERKQTTFSVSNSYDRPVVSRAIPSVSPARAADYLNKIECFCFQKQALQARETKALPLVFFISPDLPEDITKLTLSYTLFDITDSD